MCTELFVDGDVTAAFEARAKSSRTKQLFANNGVLIERYRIPSPITLQPMSDVCQYCEGDNYRRDSDFCSDECEANFNDTIIRQYRITINTEMAVDALEMPRDVFNMLRGIAIGRGYERA